MTPIKTMSVLAAIAALLALRPAQAAVPGISGTSFALVASDGFSSQPDGAAVYSWGYGCDSAPAGYVPLLPAAPFTPAAPPSCPQMQLPGPTMVVTEGVQFTVTLRNGLPAAAGNTSILFPGMTVTTSGGAPGLLTQEATPTNTVTYTVTANTPGTHAYYSGTQADVQIEMGLFGAIVVLPSSPPATCAKGQFSLSGAAYDNASTCYDREYLFQFSEMDSRIHDQVQAKVRACSAASCPPLSVRTEPYRPNYFLVNGRSMPDDMDSAYAPGYAHQPYNANPHMHPGEKVLMRIIGQGHIQHPFHFHGNHARVLARDGNMILNADGVSLAGPLLFTTPTVSGQTQDQIFTWTGKGLNWDVYNHQTGDGSKCNPDANGYQPATRLVCSLAASTTCTSDAQCPSGGGTCSVSVANANAGEWCADHLKPIPATPPDPNIVAIGQWYGGTPYLGLQTTGAFTTTNEPPGTLNQNPEAGYAYMWHSHNEREITTNDVFPGGMLSMLLIDPPSWFIDETL